MEIYEKTNIFLHALEILLIVLIGLRYLTCNKENRTDAWRIGNLFLILMLFIICILSVVKNQIVALLVGIAVI